MRHGTWQKIVLGLAGSGFVVFAHAGAFAAKPEAGKGVEAEQVPKTPFVEGVPRDHRRMPREWVVEADRLQTDKRLYLEAVFVGFDDGHIALSVPLSLEARQRVAEMQKIPVDRVPTQTRYLYRMGTSSAIRPFLERRIGQMVRFEITPASSGRAFVTEVYSPRGN